MKHVGGGSFYSVGRGSAVFMTGRAAGKMAHRVVEWDGVTQTERTLAPDNIPALPKTTDREPTLRQANLMWSRLWRQVEDHGHGYGYRRIRAFDIGRT